MGSGWCSIAAATEPDFRRIGGVEGSDCKCVTVEGKDRSPGVDRAWTYGSVSLASSCQLQSDIVCTTCCA